MVLLPGCHFVSAGKVFGVPAKSLARLFEKQRLKKKEGKLRG
jgi:hypothetical protein